MVELVVIFLSLCMHTGLFHELPVGDDAPNKLNVIIEIGEGSRIKYEYEKKHSIVMVDRFLHTPIPYPFSYGLIPQTWNDYDDDPLDVVLISSEPIMPGSVCPCRVIGMISVDDTGERDDKILCVPVGDPYMAEVKEFEDVSLKKREDIEYFLRHYKDLEKNKYVDVKAWVSASEAKEFVEECMECYNKKHA